MERQIAWLRGINLGQTRRISMPELRETLERLGYDEVRTYLQSGNVVLGTDLAPARLADELQQQIAAHLGVDDVPVIVRTPQELADVVRRNPLGDVATDPKRYHVSFLSDRPDPEKLKALRALDVAPDQVVFSQREIYIWRPDGMQRSRSARLISDERLGVMATARNWTTVEAVLALAQE